MYTRPQSASRGGSGGNMVERALAAGLITREEARATILKGIEKGRSGKTKPTQPKVLEGMSTMRGEYENAQKGGLLGYGKDPALLVAI
jgi:hypothetical protein